MGTGGEPFCVAGERRCSRSQSRECPRTLLATAGVSGLGRYRLPGLSQPPLRSSPPPGSGLRAASRWPFKRQPRPLAPRPPPPWAGCRGWEPGLADGRDGADGLDGPTRAGVG